LRKVQPARIAAAQRGQCPAGTPAGDTFAGPYPSRRRPQGALSQPGVDRINVGMEDEEALRLVSDLIKHAIQKKYYRNPDWPCGDDAAIVPDYWLRALYVPRSQPDRIIVNARCLGGVDGPSVRRTHFFDGRHSEEAQRRRIAEGRSYIRFRIGWGIYPGSRTRPKCAPRRCRQRRSARCRTRYRIDNRIGPG
jgi:hypothetical protein